MSAPDTSAHESAQRLAERYGAPSPRRRRALVAASVLLAAVFLGWLAWVALSHGSPSVRSDIERWQVVDEHEVRVTVVVTQDGDAEDVRCLVRAVAADKNTVGEQSWAPDGPGREEVSIRTERRATSVELVGCTADGQVRPR